ncbi:MFS transporter [Pasteurella testudinis]|uniref:MFS transporter n=1 Tax=Pasteurella testudinis TaxID=761 RepID=UPI004058CE22
MFSQFLFSRFLPDFHHEQPATKAVFFLAGFITAAWAAIIPFVKANVQISDGTMGLMLLCLGGGALVGMPIAGGFSAKYGCRRVLISAVCGCALLFPLLIFVSSPLALAVVLVLFGTCLGITDCTMNIQAVMVEKASATPLMSGFHGFYSLGGMCGALVLTALLSLGVNVVVACFLTVAFIFALLGLCQVGFRRDIAEQQGQLFALPKGVVFYIGVVCFVFFLAEGTVLDWSGIFLSEYRAVPNASAGLGVACFSVAMTIGRLLGDRAVSYIGAKPMMLLGSLTAMFGFLLSLSLDLWQAALVGYSLIGLGCSNIVPILFSATGKQAEMPEALAVTAVSTLGYVGVLAGPALVGLGAEIYSLPTALFFVVGLIFLATLLSRRIHV